MSQQERKTIIFDEYEKLRAEYRAFFGEDAPHCMPIDMDNMAADIRDAIEQGKPLATPPNGYVT